ncbi:MAG: ribD, partial [Bacteroidetes bacterium]|nr:ribD [Bacteroidota bacterium]
SPEGRDFGQLLRLGADALLVGAGTVLSDNPELTYRGTHRKAKPLTRVILDSELQVPSDARLFQTSPEAPVLIFCTRDAAQARRAELEREGVEVLPVPSTGEELDLQVVLQELGQRGISEVLVEGGSRVHWSFLSSGLVDKFYFIVAPLVLGGENAVPSIGGKGYEVVADAPRFRIRNSFYAGPDVVLETYPAFSRSIISPWLSSEETPSGAQDLLRSSRRK